MQKSLILVSRCMKIGVKITVTFFAIAFLSMLVIGVISYKRTKSSFEKQSFEKLTTVREMKANQIQDYFNGTFAVLQQIDDVCNWNKSINN